LPVIRGFSIAAAVALAPLPGLAQTPAPVTEMDLLQPSLEGNPANPPRFRRPGQTRQTTLSQADQPPPGRFVAPSRIGATPVYGSPTGFGAGDTGFDSSNTPRRKKRAKAQARGAAGAIGAPGIPGAPEPETTFTPIPTFTPPPPPKPPPKKKPPPPEIHPTKAAARPGTVVPPPPDEPPISNPPPEVHPLAAANRPGAVLPVPPGLDVEDTASTPPPTTPPPNTLAPGVLPQRLLPFGDNDPYAALGIRAGSFLLLPSLDLSGAYTSNAEHGPGNSAAPYFVAAPELQVRSDWERHSLTADIAASYTEYGDHLVPSLNAPYVNSKIDGRVDVSRDTKIVLENRFLVATDNPGSPNLPAGLAQLPINTTVGGTVGVQQQFNRFSFSLKGTFDRANYFSSLLTDGEISSNTDRNFNQYAGILRAGYDLSPAIKPFVEVQEDDRIHDLQFDRSGLQRDSTGTTAKVGAAVDMFGSLTGEMAGGYVDRRYQDPTLPDVTGFVADGALIWQATPLTTAKLSATSQVYETVLPATTATLTRDITLQIDHAFLLWFIGTLKGGYGTDDYVGSPLLNRRYFVSAGLTYKLNRDVQVRGEVRQDWLTSTEPGFSYTGTTVLLGLRLQR